MHIMQSRRHFLASASMAAAAGVLDPRSSLADEGSPETTTLRLDSHAPALRGTAVHHRGAAARGRFHRHPLRADHRRVTTRSHAASSTSTSIPRPWLASHLDAGEPVTVLAGVHSGCFELFAHEPIRTISDLKDKRVGIRTSALAGTCSSASWLPTLGSTLTTTSTGSRAPQSGRRSFSTMARSTRFSPSPPSRRSCAPARSVG